MFRKFLLMVVLCITLVSAFGSDDVKICKQAVKDGDAYLSHFRAEKALLKFDPSTTLAKKDQ